MRKNVCSFVLVSLIAFLASMNAYADTVSITGDVFPGALSSGGIFVSPMILYDHTNEIPFIGFCGDYTTTTSTTFKTTGQDYGYSFLAEDSFYEPIQKNYIQSLFDHAYSAAFDVSGNLLNAEIGRAIQIALWSIITDPAVYNPPSSSFNGKSLADDFMKALTGEITWEFIGYGDTNDSTIIVVFRSPDNASQTLISANYVTGGSGDPEPTPEPATLLIFGFGAIGAGFAARRQMTK